MSQLQEQNLIEESGEIIVSDLELEIQALNEQLRREMEAKELETMEEIRKNLQEEKLKSDERKMRLLENRLQGNDNSSQIAAEEAQEEQVQPQDTSVVIVHWKAGRPDDEDGVEIKLEIEDLLSRSQASTAQLEDFQEDTPDLGYVPTPVKFRFNSQKSKRARRILFGKKETDLDKQQTVEEDVQKDNHTQTQTTEQQGNTTKTQEHRQQAAISTGCGGNDGNDSDGGGNGNNPKREKKVPSPLMDDEEHEEQVDEDQTIPPEQIPFAQEEVVSQQSPISNSRNDTSVPNPKQPTAFKSPVPPATIPIPQEEMVSPSPISMLQYEISALNSKQPTAFRSPVPNAASTPMSKSPSLNLHLSTSLASTLDGNQGTVNQPQRKLPVSSRRADPNTSKSRRGEQNDQSGSGSILPTLTSGQELEVSGINAQQPLAQTSSDVQPPLGIQPAQNNAMSDAQPQKVYKVGYGLNKFVEINGLPPPIEPYRTSKLVEGTLSHAEAQRLFNDVIGDDLMDTIPRFAPFQIRNPRGGQTYIIRVGKEAQPQVLHLADTVLWSHEGQHKATAANLKHINKIFGKAKIQERPAQTTKEFCKDVFFHEPTDLCIVHFRGKAHSKAITHKIVKELLEKFPENEQVQVRQSRLTKVTSLVKRVIGKKKKGSVPSSTPEEGSSDSVSAPKTISPKRTTRAEDQIASPRKVSAHRQSRPSSTTSRAGTTSPTTTAPQYDTTSIGERTEGSHSASQGRGSQSEGSPIIEGGTKRIKDIFLKGHVNEPKEPQMKQAKPTVVHRDKHYIMGYKVAFKLLEAAREDEREAIDASCHYIAEPKGGQVYLFNNKSLKVPWHKHLLVDSLRWHNKETKVFDQLGMTFRTDYVVIDGRKDPRFKRHSYADFKAINVVIHFVGDETVFVGQPHGNATLPNPTIYMRKSKLMEEQVRQQGARKPGRVHDELVNEHTGAARSVLAPGNIHQINYIKRKMRDETSLGTDYGRACQELEKVIGNAFIRNLTTIPHVRCTVMSQKAVDEILTVINSLPPDERLMLHYDTTFSVGPFYLTILSYKHPLIRIKEVTHQVNEEPTVPLACLIHERKLENDHRLFAEDITRIIDQNSTSGSAFSDCQKTFISDREFDGITLFGTNTKNAYCWRHLHSNMERKLTSLGVTKDERKEGVAGLFRMLHSESEAAYERKRDELFQNCDSIFSVPAMQTYWMQNMDDTLRNSACVFALEEAKIRDPTSGVTNNPAEGINSAIQRLKERPSNTLPQGLMLMYTYLENNAKNVTSAYYSVGPYRVKPEFDYLMQPENDLPIFEIISEKEIIERAREGLSIEEGQQYVPTIQEMAKTLVDSKLIQYNALANSFIVPPFEESGMGYLTQIDGTCTCGYTGKGICCHVLAVRVQLKLQPDYTFDETATNKNLKALTKKPNYGSKQVPRAALHDPSIGKPPRTPLPATPSTPGRGRLRGRGRGRGSKSLPLLTSQTVEDMSKSKSTHARKSRSSSTSNSPLASPLRYADRSSTGTLAGDRSSSSDYSASRSKSAPKESGASKRRRSSTGKTMINIIDQDPEVQPQTPKTPSRGRTRGRGRGKGSKTQPIPSSQTADERSKSSHTRHSRSSSTSSSPLAVPLQCSSRGASEGRETSIERSTAKKKSSTTDQKDTVASQTQSQIRATKRKAARKLSSSTDQNTDSNDSDKSEVPSTPQTGPSPGSRSSMLLSSKAQKDIKGTEQQLQRSPKKRTVTSVNDTGTPSKRARTPGNNETVPKPNISNNDGNKVQTKPKSPALQPPPDTTTMSKSPSKRGDTPTTKPYRIPLMKFYGNKKTPQRTATLPRQTRNTPCVTRATAGATQYKRALVISFDTEFAPLGKDSVPRDEEDRLHFTELNENALELDDKSFIVKDLDVPFNQTRVFWLKNKKIKFAIRSHGSGNGTVLVHHPDFLTTYVKNIALKAIAQRVPMSYESGRVTVHMGEHVSRNINLLSASKTLPEKPKAQKRYELACYCNLPVPKKTDKNTLQCDTCLDFFHADCVRNFESYTRSKTFDEYICIPCRIPFQGLAWSPAEGPFPNSCTMDNFFTGMGIQFKIDPTYFERAWENQSYGQNMEHAMCRATIGATVSNESDKAHEMWYQLLSIHTEIKNPLTERPDGFSSDQKVIIPYLVDGCTFERAVTCYSCKKEFDPIKVNTIELQIKDLTHRRRQKEKDITTTVTPQGENSDIYQQIMDATLYYQMGIVCNGCNLGTVMASELQIPKNSLPWFLCIEAELIDYTAENIVDDCTPIKVQNEIYDCCMAILYANNHFTSIHKEESGNWIHYDGMGPEGRRITRLTPQILSKKVSTIYFLRKLPKLP